MKLNEVIAKYGNQEVDESKIKEVLGVKESNVWKPNEDEEYWFIYGNGDIESNDWRGYSDENYFIYGNCFKTQKEAEFARDKQIFLTKFERYLRENEVKDIDYRIYNQYKYCLEFDYMFREIEIQSRYWYGSQGTIYTTNILALKQFISENESDIKKYMFGVE